ncbi:hypothetical protein [Saccharicrinis aurantiacus]|uniref:hypothetical protein n=1 Tax=Saccharicrinis aurantiacus TaxID=1849719 RepID=UPI0024934702|nr:hypothetical protein [Saccharicrinis aurantiacus]
MKYYILMMIISVGIKYYKLENELNHLKPTKWTSVVLRNEAKFKNRDDINYGSSFLVKLDTGVIACTARDFTGTHYTHGEMLSVKDFSNELLSWKMYTVPNKLNFISVKSLALKERIESFYNPRTFLAFNVNLQEGSIDALEPDVSLIKNKERVYIVGYGSDDKLRIIEGVVETSDNAKVARLDLRIRTKEFLSHWNYVGSPIINKEGKVIGVFNRAYRLKYNNKGRIVSEKKDIDDSSYKYFVNGTQMRLILGKKYGK